jgi:hypothetical protein
VKYNIQTNITVWSGFSMKICPLITIIFAMPDTSLTWLNRSAISSTSVWLRPASREQDA